MDVTQMSDDDLNKVIETGVEPEPDVPETPEVVEETPESTPEPEQTEGAEEPTEAPVETPEAPPSRRETLRVQQLLEKMKQQPASSLPQTAPTQAMPDPLNYGAALDADPEVIQRLEADRQAYSDAAYQQGIRQSEVREWKRDLKFESPTVEKDFPFLNPRDAANFNPVTASAMNEKYLRFVGYTPGDAQRGIPEGVLYPDISYREFVEGEMEFAEEIASRKVAETARNVAKQAATTGLRPDGSSAKRLNLNKAPQDMSMEELYAFIGQKPPETK